MFYNHKTRITQFVIKMDYYYLNNRVDTVPDPNSLFFKFIKLI